MVVIIQKQNEPFTFIASSIYYDSEVYKQVYDYKLTAKKNQIIFGIAERKRYNKIILLSNVGPNQIGKQFVLDARKKIESNVIVLFVAFNEDYLCWIKKYPNALFTNRSEYEK